VKRSITPASVVRDLGYEYILAEKELGKELMIQ